MAKEAPKRKCSSKKKAGVEFIQEHEIPQWVTDLRCSQLEEEKEEVVGDQLQSEFTLLPGEYEIVLIVDFAEVVTGGGGTKARGGSASNKKPNALKELTANGVSHPLKSLKLSEDSKVSTISFKITNFGLFWPESTVLFYSSFSHFPQLVQGNTFWRFQPHKKMFL